MQARASFKQCPIVYTTSPYSLNWVYTDYIRPFHKTPEKFADLELVQARSDENPYFPKEEFERKRLTMDPRRFNMIYGGEFNKIEGLVYDNFYEDTHICAQEPLPDGTIIVAGVDWGYRDPTVIIIVAIYPNGTVRVIGEHYKTQQTINDIVQVAKQLKVVYNIDRFYCDPSQPASIQEFNRAKLSAIPAVNDIRPGVDAVYDLVSSGNFKVFSGKAPYMIDEMSIYHYRSDPDVHADKDIKEVMPVDQYNHCMDALRYCIFSIKDTLLRKNKVISHENKDLRLHANDALLLKNTEEWDW